MRLDSVRNSAKKRFVTRKFSGPNYLLKCLRKNAKKKGIPVTLTVAQVTKKLAPGVCSMTGIAFQQSGTRKHRNPFVASIDRIESAGPYSDENCRAVIWAVNCARHTWNDETMLLVARALVESHSRLGHLTGPHCTGRSTQPDLVGEEPHHPSEMVQLAFPGMEPVPADR